jgi:hypothetical protein
MFLRLRVEVFGEHRRVADDGLRGRMLAVEDAQRIAFEPTATVGVERFDVLAKVILQQRAVRLARFGSAERIDLQLHARQA